MFDALGAPFWVDADDFAQDATLADPAVRLWRWFAGKDGTGAAPPVAGEGRSALAVAAGPVGSELQISFGALDGAHMSFASQPVAVKARLGDAVLSMFASAGSGNEVGVHALDADAHGLALAWSPAGRQAVLRAGWTRETDTLFGSSAEGAFGKLSSGLSFVGASGGFEAGGWRIGIAGEIGRATPEAAGGLLADADASAFSTAFSAEAVRALAGGTLRLSLQQPLRIESGRLHLSLPMRRTPEEGGRAPADSRWPRAVGPPDRLRRQLDEDDRAGRTLAGRGNCESRAGPRRRPESGGRFPRRSSSRAVAVRAAPNQLGIVEKRYEKVKVAMRQKWKEKIVQWGIVGSSVLAIVIGRKQDQINAFIIDHLGIIILFVAVVCAVLGMAVYERKMKLEKQLESLDEKATNIIERLDDQ